MKNKIKFICLIIVAIIIAGLCGLIIYKGVKAKTDGTVHPIATFEIENYGTIDIELYPEYAPNTVTNFIALIQKGYYNNKIIFGKDDICLYMGRTDEEDEEESEESDEDTTLTVDLDKNEEVTNNTVADNTVTDTTTSEEEKNEYTTTMASIFDSSIEKDSDDDYEYEIDGEFIANGFNKNTLRHEKGIISLNRSDYSTYGLSTEGYNSGKAMFSIMMSDDTEGLNGVYCAFGKIVNGMDILEKIYSECEIVKEESEDGSEDDSSSIDEFATYPVIKSATVETYGVDYGIPEYHEAYDINSYINQMYLKYYQNN